MYLSRLTLCAVVLVSVTFSNPEREFSFPHATIEVYRPQGLRVSIPDFPGTKLFAFHGSVNKDIGNLDRGDITKDVYRKSADKRWVFEDKNAYLEIGDELNYWLFVIVNSLGRQSSIQTYIVENVSPQPPGFGAPIRRPGKPPHPSKNPSEPSRTPVLPSVIPASSPNQPTCKCPTQPAPTQAVIPVCPPSTTHAPQAMQETMPDIVGVWTQSLLNLTEENQVLREKLQTMNSLNNILVKVVESSGGSNLKKLKLSGRISPSSDPLDVVKSVLKEKLHVKIIVESAERNPDNSITFELESHQDKLIVLLSAEQNLSNSKIIISDV